MPSWLSFLLSGLALLGLIAFIGEEAQKGSLAKLPLEFWLIATLLIAGAAITIFGKV